MDQEVNLLEGLTFAEGLTLQKVEVEQDGARSEIAHPEAYSPQIPGAISIILTLSRTDGSTIEVKVDNLSVQGIQYQAMKITDLKPVEILPIIGQIVAGDKKVYDHIEHLRIAEATRIRDMMWEYGAGAHSSTEYQVLMGRLYAGMALETPGYDNFEVIGTAYYTTPSYHATTLWSILDELLNKARLFICNPVSGSGSWFNLILEHSDNHPNCIYVV